MEGDMTEDNIIKTIKASLGLAEDYPPFDAQIVMEINTVLSIVNQLGIGVNGYEVCIDNGAYTGTWSEFLANEIADNIFMNEVKTYVAKRVQILFDPPTSGILMDAMNRNIEELEWRIVCHKETP